MDYVKPLVLMGTFKTVLETCVQNVMMFVLRAAIAVDVLYAQITCFKTIMDVILLANQWVNMQMTKEYVNPAFTLV